MINVDFPRMAVAGLAGDTGKSLVTLGLASAFRKLGRRVAPFKKGPDYIDAAWLAEACGTAGRNLDTFLMPPEAIIDSLCRASRRADIALIEGNRGLFDGMDARGAHSTAQLARLTGTPVILVVDAAKATRTLAALVLGCVKMEPGVKIAGVILNRVGTARQEAVIREAIQIETGIPVFGAIPRLAVANLPSRRLGLVTPGEHPDAREALDALGEAVSLHVDLQAVLKAAGTAERLSSQGRIDKPPIKKPSVTIGVLKDRAFSFYYPENLEALEEAGAELSFVSPLDASGLPAMNALYAGGGFPEEHARELSANVVFREALKKRIDEGLPVWAECGGLMYLAETLKCGENVHPMVGALPIAVELMAAPQGHGYVQAAVNRPNPFLPERLEFRGHEFHYSRLSASRREIETALILNRGVGIGDGRDGLRSGGVMAAYTHVHALGMPEFAEGLVSAAHGKAM